MKSIYLFGTKPLMYLCELPVLFLLGVSIYFNDKVEGALGLYPLIFVCIGAIIFMFLFLFRGISVSTEEVRSFGPYSSKDTAIINKDKLLVLTVRPKGKLRVELYGSADKPVFDWLREEDASKGEINLYRDTTVGGVKAVGRVLNYFGISPEECSEIHSAESFSREYDFFILTKETAESGERYLIKFTETI